MHARVTTVEVSPAKLDEATHLSVSPLPKPSNCWLGSPGVFEISSAGAGAGTNSKRASCRQCGWSLSPATCGDRSQGRADPERCLAGRVDHLGLPCDYRAQNFLLFLLGHIEVVERTTDLRSNLVELFRSDMEVLVGFAQLPARVGKGPPGRCAEPEGPHELKAWQVALLVIFI